MLKLAQEEGLLRLLVVALGVLEGLGIALVIVEPRTARGQHDRRPQQLNLIRCERRRRCTQDGITLILKRHEALVHLLG